MIISGLTNNMGVASLIFRLICTAYLVKCIYGLDACDFIDCGDSRECEVDKFGFIHCKCPSTAFEFRGVCLEQGCLGIQCGTNQECQVNKSTRKPECVCKTGYWPVVKGDKCVECPEPKLPTTCAPNCPKTCETIASRRPPICRGNRFACRRDVNCICPPGFVEKSFTDSTCVEESKCRDPCHNIRCNFNSHCVGGKCKCDEGYVRKGSFCLPETKKCISPQVETKCAAKCPATCENPIPRGSCRYTCDKTKKCVCRRGWLEKSATDSTCVRPKQCTASDCPAPKVPTQCATFCPATCENHGKPGNCIMACNTRKKCVCPKGMVERSSRDSTCVPLSSCPPDPCSICPSNSRCINKRCVCYRDLIFVNGKCVEDPCRKCPANSQCIANKCECNRGFVLVGGKCVIDVCQSCPDNSRCLLQVCVCEDGFVRDGEFCIPDPCANCPQNSNCINGKCVCKPGFVKKDGKCVPIGDPCQNCPENSKCINRQCVCNDGFEKQGDKCVGVCPTNKVWTRCASSCPKTCKTKDLTFPQTCEGCRPNVNCVCAPGYVENHFGDSICIAESNCPARNPCDFIRCFENSVCDRFSRECVCRKGFQKAGFRRCRRVPN